MRYGYARVSSSSQDLAIQKAALQAAKCDLVLGEKASATERTGRAELERLLQFAREGDTIVVTRIDRLARSVRDLQNIVHELTAKGVSLQATEQPIDTTTPEGKAFLGMLSVFAEFETNLRKERQREGIDAAMAAGRYKGGGRKPKIDATKVHEMKAQGMGATAIAKALKINRDSVYRVLGQQPAG